MMCEMENKMLNITNGEYFNQYFISKFGGIAIPFCEAMMEGEGVSDIYSQKFIELRAKSLNVTENEYKSKMFVYAFLNNDNYPSICLWFGKDTFCQMNLLMLLAYLEQIGYQGKIILNYIDDETFEVLESNIEVKLGTYSKIYEDVLVSKTVPKSVGVLSERAIDLFFDYHSDNGELAKLVMANAKKEKMELIHLLLDKSKDYGLSDLQAERLIISARLVQILDKL